MWEPYEGFWFQCAVRRDLTAKKINFMDSNYIQNMAMDFSIAQTTIAGNGQSQCPMPAAANCPAPNELNSHLMQLLGDDVVFLPCKQRQKGSRDQEWQKYTVERMKDPDYIRRLNSASSLAVSLGAPSGGLCSIDIDDDADVEPFLELNPAFRSTLMSRGHRGANIWVRIKGDYPGLAMLKRADGSEWGEWRATGGCTMINGQHPNGVWYSRAPEVKPLDLPFANIVWPENILLPWHESNDQESQTDEESDDQLVRRYGEPVFFAQNKAGVSYVKSVNEPYWAGLYAAEHVVLYEPDERKFYVYEHSNGLYVVRSENLIKQEISARMLEVSRESSELSGLEKMRSDRTLAAIIAQLRGIVERRNAFADRPKILHLQNCALRVVRILALREEFSPAFLSRNRSPIAYDPDAKCPRFLEELVLPGIGRENVLLLQKYVGQCLLGENLIQRFLILDGNAGCGKTQLANVIQALIGRENITQLRTNHLGDRFELYRFIGRTLLVGVDVDADFLSTKGASVIKGLVGGDWFDAEQKGGNGAFPLQGNFNVLMTSNNRLKIRLQGDIDAWKRRMLLIRYENHPPKNKIPNFSEKLIQEEGPGILNWAIEGLNLLMLDITLCGGIILNGDQKGVVDSLLAESDSLRSFLLKNLVQATGSDLTVNEIVQAYARYCPDMSWDPLPETQIHRQLPSLMLELFQTPKSNSIKRDGVSARGFRGVAFKGLEVVA